MSEANDAYTFKWIDELQAEIVSLTTALAASRAREVKMREALEPFAKLSKYMPNVEKVRDGAYCSGSPGILAEITCRDYHIARAALSAKGDAT